MEKLPVCLEEIVLDYKNQLEVSEKFDKCLVELKKVSKIIKIECEYEWINEIVSGQSWNGVYIVTNFIDQNGDLRWRKGRFLHSNMSNQKYCKVKILN